MSLDAFTETGADIYALAYDRLAFDSLSSTLGLRYDWRVEQRRGSFTPGVRLEWTHAFDHAGPQTTAYADWLASPRYGVALNSWITIRSASGWTATGRSGNPSTSRSAIAGRSAPTPPRTGCSSGF